MASGFFISLVLFFSVMFIAAILPSQPGSDCTIDEVVLRISEAAYCFEPRPLEEADFIRWTRYWNQGTTYSIVKDKNGFFVRCVVPFQQMPLVDMLKQEHEIKRITFAMSIVQCKLLMDCPKPKVLLNGECRSKQITSLKKDGCPSFSKWNSNLRACITEFCYSSFYLTAEGECVQAPPYTARFGSNTKFKDALMTRGYYLSTLVENGIGKYFNMDSEVRNCPPSGLIIDDYGYVHCPGAKLLKKYEGRDEVCELEELAIRKVIGCRSPCPPGNWFNLAKKKCQVANCFENEEYALGVC